MRDYVRHCSEWHDIPRKQVVYQYGSPICGQGVPATCPCVGLMAAGEYIPLPSLKTAFYRELSLDGTLSAGVLPIAMMLQGKGWALLILPVSKAAEASCRRLGNIWDESFEGSGRFL